MFPWIQLFALGAGTIARVVGTRRQTRATERAERLRAKQVQLESVRQRRQAVRNAQAARALALSTSVNQGASGGSGIQGGLSQITAQAGQNVLGINQGEEIGLDIFSANRSASRGAALASFGSGLTSFGSSLGENPEAFSRLSRLFGGRNG